MCTVTVRREAAGVLVTMNRDESRQRGPERPPAIERFAEGGAWLAPRDSDRGGAWFGVNDAGTVACLLNRYGSGSAGQPENSAPGAAPSRGAIVPEVLARGAAGRAALHIETAFDPQPYPPFTLVAAGRSLARRYDWDGMRFAWADLPPPWALVSSSWFDTEAVLAYRAAAFSRWLGSGAPFEGVLPAIHLQHEPGREAYSVLMERTVSRTLSITQAAVPAEPGAPITLRYAPVRGGALDISTFALPTA